jgi:predicted site-specific integrase-resolvase
MPTATQTQPTFLTTAQLCARWQCSEETLRNYKKDGKLHPSRPGGKLLYPLDEIERIEEESK